MPRATFYRWYDQYQTNGPEALADRPSSPSRVWNRIPPDIHDQIIELALEATELSPQELALTASGCDQAHVQHKPRLLSDNGSSYISSDLAEWLDDRRMKHVRGAPYHPQTQGKDADKRSRLPGKRRRFGLGIEAIADLHQTSGLGQLPQGAAHRIIAAEAGEILTQKHVALRPRNLALDQLGDRACRYGRATAGLFVLPAANPHELALFDQLSESAANRT